MSYYQLYKKIRDVRTTSSRLRPDEGWIASTRSTLMMQVKNSLPVQPVQKKQALQNLFKVVTPVVSLKWLRTPAFAMAAVLLALFGGSLLSVSAAEQALPGDFLYSVKLATEQARLALAKDPEEKLKLKTEFTERRIQEIKQVIASPLSDDRSSRVIQTAEALKRDLHTLKQQLDDTKQTVTPAVAMDLAKSVDAKANDVVQSLQDSKGDLTPEEKAKVTEAQVAASDASVKAIEVLVTTHQQAADVVTEKDVTELMKAHSDMLVKTVNDTITNATQSTTTGDVPAAAGTTATASTTNDAMKQVQDAQKSFADADKLASENKMNEAVDMIKDATNQAFAAQKAVELNLSVTSSPAVLPINTTTTTKPITKP